MASVICIEKRDAERVRQKLIKLGVYDHNFRPLRVGKKVCFAVKGPARGFKVVEKKLEPLRQKPKSIAEALKGKLTEKELASLITSFDMIGDIAVLEIPKELEKKEKEIARAVLVVHKNVKVVAKKAGAVSKRYRTRKLKVLLGEKRTTTEYTEHACRFRLDIARAYFSPRFAYERKRIARQVKPGEKVLALFAGVGPFPIVIAKFQPRVEIVAAEWNPDACKFLKQNIKLNRMDTTISPICGDVKKILPDYANWADRIIMPHPGGAHEFLADAMKAGRKGCVIHFYHFAPMEKPFDDAWLYIRKAAKQAGRKATLVKQREVRPYSPDTVQVVVDFKIR